MTDTQVAYIAGLIDGEGCLTIVSGKSHHKYRCYNPMLIVTNTSKSLVAIIQQALGGTIFTQTRIHPEKDAHHLKVTGPALYAALDLIIPYLTLKQSEAVILRAYLDVTNAQRGKKLTDPQIAVRDAFVRKLQDLKALAHLQYQELTPLG